MHKSSTHKRGCFCIGGTDENRMYGRRTKTTDEKRTSINGGSFVSNYSERKIIGYYQKSAAQYRFSGEHEIRIFGLV